MLTYTGRSGQSVIDVQSDGETVWFAQTQLVRLFDSSKANIGGHIKNIFTEGELDAEAVVRKFRTVQTEGNRKVSRKSKISIENFIAVLPEKTTESTTVQKLIDAV